MLKIKGKKKVALSIISCVMLCLLLSIAYIPFAHYLEERSRINKAIEEYERPRYVFLMHDPEVADEKIAYLTETRNNALEYLNSGVTHKDPAFPIRALLHKEHDDEPIGCLRVNWIDMNLNVYGIYLTQASGPPLLFPNVIDWRNTPPAMMEHFKSSASHSCAIMVIWDESKPSGPRWDIMLEVSYIISLSNQDLWQGMEYGFIYEDGSLSPSVPIYIEERGAGLLFQKPGSGTGGLRLSPDEENGSGEE